MLVARAVLSLRERHLEFAGADERQYGLSLRVGAASRHELRTQPDRRQVRFDDERLADRLHDAHQIDRAAAETADVRRERQAEQADLGERRPDRIAVALARRDELPARLERVIL